MIHEDGKHALQVSFEFTISIQSRHSERIVRTNRSATPFALRHPKWRANDLDTLALEHLVEALGEFLIPVSNQKTK